MRWGGIIRRSESYNSFPFPRGSGPGKMAPLQQLAYFRHTDVIAVSPHVKVPPRAPSDEGRVATVQVLSVRII